MNTSKAQTPPTNAKAPKPPQQSMETITAVRELLFGDQMGEVQEQVVDLQNLLLQEVHNVREELREFKGGVERQIQVTTTAVTEAAAKQKEEQNKKVTEAKKEVTAEVRSLKKSVDLSLRNFKESRVTRKELADILSEMAASLRGGK